MRRRRLLAEALRVKNPCRVGYANLTPETERSRHCAHCDQSVIDVSKLTRREAEALLEARERGAHLCVHLVVREADGAVLLADGHATLSERSAARPGRRLALAASTAALVACARPGPETAVVVAVPPEPPPAAAPVALASPEPPEVAAAEPPAPSPAEPPAPSSDEPPTALAPSNLPAPVAPASKPAKAASKSKSKPARAPHTKVVAPHIEIDGNIAW